MIADPAVGTSIIWSDPVALGDSDRVGSMLRSRYVDGAPMHLIAYGERSMDAANWITIAPAFILTAGGLTPMTVLDVSDVIAAFLRVRFELQPNAAVCSIGFDFQINLDRK